MTAPLRLATRGSALARAQAGTVADAVAARAGRPVELVTVATTGDTDPRALTVIGGTGVFVGAVRAAVLSGAADLAVHSFKDLPTAPPDGLVLGAVPAREDPRDALVARDGLRLADFPDGSRIGTGSPRRAAQLAGLARSAGRRWDVVPVRGNVDTRLAAVGDGLDAVVVAAAGLARLGRLDRATELLDPSAMLPAPAQGALAVETADPAPDELSAALAALDDRATRAAATAERAVLAELGAGCSAPVGAHATVDGAGWLSLSALVAVPDGPGPWRASAAGPVADAAGLGATVARALLADGAGALPSLAAGAA